MTMKQFFKNIDLTEGNVMKNLLLFALPFFVSNFLNCLYSAIDLMFIGQCSDTYNIAAVSTGTTIMFAINSIILGLATGGSIVIGQYFGAKNKNISDVTKTFITYMSIVALIITLLMLIIFYPLAKWMQLDEQSIGIARQYLLILIIGIPFYCGYHCLSAILRANGNSTAPFLFLLVTVIINIILDAIFIIVLDMGAIGAAIATLIGEVCGFFFANLYLIFNKLPYRINYNLQFYKGAVRDFIKCGLPIAIQDGLIIISFTIILAVISSRGVNFTSAVGITDRVTNFGFAPMSAISSAVSTAAAQNAGAKKVDNIKKYMKCGIIISLIAGSIITLICQLIPYQLASIFGGNNKEAVELAVPYIRSTSTDILICSAVFSINAIFFGSGHTIFAMTQNLAATFLVRLPVALILAIGVNTPLWVVGFAYPLSTLFSTTLCVIYYKSKRWMTYKSSALALE